MTRIALATLLVAFTGCIDGMEEPELVWNIDVALTQLVVGQTTEAHSAESLPSGESPMPLIANWYASPDGIVSLSNDVASTITLTALVPGNVTLHASAGGLQTGAPREVQISVVPELVWNVDVTLTQLVVGQTTEAHSAESLPSGESPMPLIANWYASPDGFVSLSSDVGSTITLTALAPGNVTLHASAGGLQTGAPREVQISVVAP